MYTDAYEFRRSQRSQSVRDDYNTYSRKDYNYLPDTNQGTYTNNSLTLVTFDLSSIYNSSRFTDTNDLVVVLPITIVAITQATAGGGVLAKTDGLVNLISLKSNYVNLIHQCDVQINGKTCNDLQPFTNVIKNFEMLSEMSPSDLQIYGPTYGFGSELDNPRSVQFTNATAIGKSGTGLTNNVPFGRVAPLAATTPASADVPQQASAYQNDGTLNKAISSRLNNFVDTTIVANGQNIYGGGITTLSRCATEFKPTYEVINGTHCVWYDYAIIRLGSILESLRNIGLTRRFDAVLRMYVNTGSIAVPVAAINSANMNYGAALQGSSTFTNTCPFTINYFPSGAAGDARNILPVTTAQICAGLFIGKPPSTNVTTTGVTAANLGINGIAHPLNSCRIYYSSIEMGDPQRALTYIESNRAKKVVYRNFVSNTITGVSQGSSYSSLIQSGLVNPVAVVVIPFINQASLFPAGGHVPQFGSPYDTCPATGCPVSLVNFQCTVGGVNQLNTTLQYSFENFIEHVSLYEQIAGTDFGVSCGLFDKKYWEMNRVYVCLIRSKFADMDTPRNINISFTNNSNVSIDLMVFSVYLDSLIIDVDTGRITR